MDEKLFIERGLAYLSSASDMRGALEHLVRAAVQSVGSDCGSLYLLDKQSGTLVPYVLVNIPAEYLKGCSTVPLGTQCCGRAALHKTPWIVTDMLTDPLFADCAEGAAEAGIRSGFSIPVLLANEECIGSLGYQFREAYSPSEYVLELGRLFAQLIAVAVSKEREQASAATEMTAGKKPAAFETRTKAVGQITDFCAD